MDQLKLREVEEEIQVTTVTADLEAQEVEVVAVIHGPQLLTSTIPMVKAIDKQDLVHIIIIIQAAAVVHQDLLDTLDLHKLALATMEMMETTSSLLSILKGQLSTLKNMI